MAIIEIENLSKKYLIDQARNSVHTSLKESITNGCKRFVNRFMPKALSFNVSPLNVIEEFWALHNLNLSIQEGDRVALLGRNGAGKSTLLKLISRITEPTHGRITIRGRVTSLLEVGTGFHPDLSGRENIFLNGVILGMSYSEIKAKFDEIVAFADVEKFLDTPIKRYSSGMFMRLGFSIAAHLDADLLILDEVLAVGDTQFQEKCLKKMNEIGRNGATVLFVSHNINSVLSLCNKGIFLEGGKLVSFEAIEPCISRYMRSCPFAGLQWKGNVGDEHIRVHQIYLRPPSSQVGFFSHLEKTYLNLEFEILKPQPDLILGFNVQNSCHQIIARSRLCDNENHRSVSTTVGPHRLSFELDLNLFHPGEYHLALDCSLLNKKKILDGEVLLKFAVCSLNRQVKLEQEFENGGISLGDRWQSG